MSNPDPNLIAGRECGECRGCCIVFAIDEPEVRKEPGEPCSHICAAGCDIYARRPPTCSTFHCAWRQTLALPDHARPDRLGVLFYVTGRVHPQTVFDNVSLVAVAIENPDALHRPEVRAVIDQFVQSALPIHQRWRDEQVLIHPAADLADAIDHPQITPHRHLVDQGRAWLARYAPIARHHAGDRVMLPQGY
ncbi:MAG: hypothetical protein JWM33_1580 [Caulobacteraceae bacterium]|nr:hypothetical protein [Caulobacteraceae bacterium]